MLLNMTVVLTGVKDEKKYKEFIEKNGGKIGSGISKTTSLLVYSSTDTNKYTKAVQLGTPTMLATDFANKYKFL